jgi:hypothetical protein
MFHKTYRWCIMDNKRYMRCKENVAAPNGYIPTSQPTAAAPRRRPCLKEHNLNSPPAGSAQAVLQAHAYIAVQSAASLLSCAGRLQGRCNTALSVICTIGTSLDRYTAHRHTTSLLVNSAPIMHLQFNECVLSTVFHTYAWHPSTWDCNETILPFATSTEKLQIVMLSYVANGVEAARAHAIAACEA